MWRRVSACESEKCAFDCVCAPPKGAPTGRLKQILADILPDKEAGSEGGDQFWQIWLYITDVHCVELKLIILLMY